MNELVMFTNLAQEEESFVKVRRLLHLSGCPVVTCEYVGHLMFSLHIDRCTFLGIYINFLFELSVWFSSVWEGIQLIVGLCINLDAASLMVLVILFKSSFLLLSMFTADKEFVCIIILSLVSLAFSSATRMAVISAASTDTE